MSNETIERTKAVITIVITAAVNIANVFGYAVDAEPIVNWTLTGLSFVTIAWSWWKNQNITGEAVMAQMYLDSIKKQSRAAHARDGE